MKPPEEDEDDARPVFADIDPDEVQVVHRINRLKQKVLDESSQEAAGYVDSALIRKAQRVIEGSQALYMKHAKTTLDELAEIWRSLKNKTSSEAAADVQHLGVVSNRLMDMASTYEYDLMSYFAMSLRDFTEKLNLSRQPHHVIVQAHIDVMWIAYNEKLKGEKGKKAEELKTIVNKAIEKFG